MCGIAGFYNFGDGADRRAMHGVGEAMHHALSHRGPDSADIWQDPDVPLLLGHRRLAIVDLSPAGAQPMASSSGRYMVVYNGEIYNYRILRDELESIGQVFKSKSDTEVLLACIENWGFVKTLQKINGMFAIALWDRQLKHIHFARDRFGKKPLYVGWAGKNLVFASELKAFHKHPDFVADINRDVLSLYMRFGFVPAPYCIFKNIWQVPPASNLTLDVHFLNPSHDLSKDMKDYWSLRDVVLSGQQNMVMDDEQNILDTFEKKLSLAVEQRMDCDVPFGSFLSGGIDSSLVTALMQKHSTRPIKTYCIGFDDGGYDESGYAAAIAAHLGTDHHEFKLTSQDAMGVIPSLCDIYDEPFADSSQIPTYLISKLARGDVTVALTGDGGDEIMGGYQRHTHAPPLWNKISRLPMALRKTIANLMLKFPQSSYDGLNKNYAQLGRRVHRAAQMMMAQNERDIYTQMMDVWPQKDTIVLGAQALPAPFDDESFWPNGLSVAEKMMFADLAFYRPHDLMVKMDRASMASSLEARAPLMDYELCEYSWRLPHSMKIRGREGKWLLRQILEKYVPRALTDRPKSGFGIPLHDWLHGPLKPWAEDLLNEQTLKDQNIFDAQKITRHWNDFKSGRGHHANASDIWTILMFQSWRARWIK